MYIEVVGVADTEKKRSQQMVREESAYMAPAARIPYYDLVIDHGEGPCSTTSTATPT